MPRRPRRGCSGANKSVEWSPDRHRPRQELAYAINLHQPMHCRVELALSERKAVAAVPYGDRAKSSRATSPPSTTTPARSMAGENARPMIGGILATAGV